MCGMKERILGDIMIERGLRTKERGGGSRSMWEVWIQTCDTTWQVQKIKGQRESVKGVGVRHGMGLMRHGVRIQK